MILDDIHSLAASGESGTLEFKQATVRLGPACGALCGFLNGKGGTDPPGNAPGDRTAMVFSPNGA